MRSRKLVATGKMEVIGRPQQQGGNSGFMTRTRCYFLFGLQAFKKISLPLFQCTTPASELHFWRMEMLQPGPPSATTAPFPTSFLVGASLLTCIATGSGTSPLPSLQPRILVIIPASAASQSPNNWAVPRCTLLNIWPAVKLAVHTHGFGVYGTRISQGLLQR